MSSSTSSSAPVSSGTGPTAGGGSGGEQENGYTFRMGDHEITMRDSFASMLDTTQLTDCLLVCHSHKDVDTDSDHDNSPDTNNGHNSARLTNGHASNGRTGSPRVSLAAPADKVPERSLATHRVILSASSDYFRSLFSSVTAQPLGVVAVVVTNVDYDDLKSIVDFIYKGQVSVGQSRIHKFLAAAQLLMVKGLMNIKLVSNDNQPLDDMNGTGGADAAHEQEMLQKLRHDKRLLEQEVRALKDVERNRSEKLRREIEMEVKKKLELEKSVLNEEKQRFEALRMKFAIEKEVYEKERARKESTIKMVVTSSSGNSVIHVSDNTSGHTTSNGQIVGQRHTPAPQRVGSQPQIVVLSVGAGGVGIQQQQQSSQSSTTESPGLSEGEGRQLRKRIKLGETGGETPGGPHESVIKTLPNSDVSKMEVDTDGMPAPVPLDGAHRPDMDDEDDGEVYEIDFSQPFDGQRGTGADHGVDLRANPQSAAIVASTLAYHKSTTSSPTQITTRALRRSTSSHGSAAGTPGPAENGGAGHHDMVTASGELVSTVRRKGPGRTPNWAKEEMNSDLEGTPETRSRKQRSSQEYLSPAMGGQPQLQTPSSGLYQCPYCPQVYHGHQSMQDHINGVHLNAKTQYICDYCGKVYTWRISLNKHLKTVHPNEPILD
ncbi:unnamed protein product [Oppiella nova]|uniref:Uncharacterized protein n=1 Tax=Oppiella nova TaxID=334625 RepID=A0A7R9LEF2_9ACAR|nr:unnamed protein product [Oppiella nova]CAG2162689.1 unnamed protein product [Oppiella nova]